MAKTNEQVPAEFFEEPATSTATVEEDLSQETAITQPPVELEPNQRPPLEYNANVEVKTQITNNLAKGIEPDPEGEIVAVELLFPDTRDENGKYTHLLIKRYRETLDTQTRPIPYKEKPYPDKDQKSFSLRWDGRAYVFRRGQTTKVPLVAAATWLGGPEILGKLGIKKYTSAEADRDARRIKSRFPGFGPIPLVMVGVEREEPKNQPLPEGTIEVS